jgi:acyl carrier protein
MFNFVEPRIRRLVAEQLGIGPEELSPIVSLTDDLAADSLDLVELGLAIEQELDIVLPDNLMAEVRTYADLLAVIEAVRQAPEDASTPPAVWARIVREQNEIHRAGWLTPYTAETIAEDAARAGRGTRLELMVSAAASDAALERLDAQFAWLRRRDVEVCVSREVAPGRRGPAAAQPTAAPRPAALGIRS